jgi:hypothetical protein
MNVAPCFAAFAEQPAGNKTETGLTKQHVESHLTRADGPVRPKIASSPPTGVRRNAATPWNSASRGLAAMPGFLFEPPFAAR